MKKTLNFSGKLTIIKLLVLVFMFSASIRLAAQNPDLIAEYDFNGSFNDKLSGSSLSAFGTVNDGYNHNNYTSEYGNDANGNYWAWASNLAQGGGLWIDVNTDISTNYSIGIRFLYNNTESGYRKIIDYKNMSSDNGFYFYGGGKFNFYPLNTLGLSTTNNNQLVDIIITRSSADDSIKAYVIIDGTLNKELAVKDAGSYSIPTLVDGKPRFHFFHDENSSQGEATPGGKVYSIKVWNGPITQAQAQTAMDISWTGAVNNDWSTTGNWDGNALPTSSDNVNIPDVINRPIIGENAACLSLTIASNAALTINSGKSLNVAGDFTILSDATGTGSFIDNGTLTVTGTTSIQKYLSGDRWWYLGSPVSNGTALAFVTLSSTASTGNRLFSWSETTHAYLNVINTDDVLPALKGYSFKRYDASSVTALFTGTFNTGEIGTNNNLTYTSGASSGFNLVCNPYPSAIDLGSSTDATPGLTMTNIEPTMWFRTDNTFATYNWTTGIGTPAGTTQFVPAMQAFWVRTKGEAGSLKFTNETRVHNSQSFYKGAVQNNVFRIWIRNGSLSDEAVIGFFANALETYEDYDSYKMFAPVNDYPQTYTLTSDNVIVAINGEPNLSVNTERIIPLGFHTHIAGTFTFDATNLLDFDANISVYLEDMQENVLQDLRINNTYVFSSGIVDNASRFRLHFYYTANPLPDVGLSVGGTASICYGTGTNITVALSEIGTYYQLRNDAGDVNVGISVAGNGSTIDLPTGNLASTTTFNVYATNGSGSDELSEKEIVTVNPNQPVSVSIAASPGTTVCMGTSVEFTATATNGGASPSCQWKSNGTNISGATNSTYTSLAVVAGDMITCVITSNAACTAGSSAASNTLIMSVAYIPVSVSIAASPGTTVCLGTSVTYSATPTNGGTAPAYQWKINGANINGATNSTYTRKVTASFNGKKITCVLTSNESCGTGSPATSNILTMAVAYQTASVSIAASPGTTVCTGTSVTFTATPTNGGTAPAYQWKKNKVNISGATNSTFTCIATAGYNGKSITCVMTSSETCVSGSSSISNILKLTVNPSPKSQIIPEAGDGQGSEDISFITRLSNESVGDDISIYPNPTTSSITLDYSGYQITDNYELKVYSFDGKLISFSKLNSKTTIIDAASYDAGIYYIRIQGDNGVLIRKFIKE